MREIKEIDLTADDLELLNSKQGLKRLFANKKIDLQKTLAEVKYELRLREQQAELVKLQTWAIANRKKIVILFEGRDAAGKGGAIRRMSAYINPRYYRIVALNKPTEDEEGQWYFQRYVNRLPKPGKIVFFDRSWYNRAVVEPVNGFCTVEQYERFMGQVNDFEKMIISSDTYLIKFYFSISKEEQAKRFDDIRKSELKRWKLSAVDEKAQGLWDEYTKYKEVMLKDTHTDHAPWVIIKADKKTEARLEAINHVLDTIPYR
ncbi:polyphosphate kinase 2 [Maribacter polysaccharolyticus]|uniref:polyphosphate kinase 2 n=1 Tax=Maribacter polysaccharolyticus TaxID=3020831 RepID=UPI00237F7CFE|nr:polyphosphate kinase 2 [Maribacter polysaccharolyticus]MDE3743926.1 polyphosphate kinase 2 [Maribacter polysaccharolyticus]